MKKVLIGIGILAAFAAVIALVFGSGNEELCD